MLFKMEFKIVEIWESGATVTHYLKGNRRNVEVDIEKYKKSARRYEMFGKEGMVVWV